MRFAKGHGTGNDFVIVPDVDGVLDLSAQDAARLCDRRFGIGGDGVLRVVRVDGEWFMDYRNADGSLAETCGNGIRVYARYLVEAGLAEPGEIPLRTRGGAVVAVVGEDGVSVDMGPPRLYGDSTATVSGTRLRGSAVDCGNPHLVCPVPAPALSGLDLSTPPGVDPGFFPAGVNVELVTPAAPLSGVDLHVRARVHERGSGETLSCGSGAVAVAAVALRDAGRPAGVVAVDLPGGRLTVTLDGATAWLSGPAVVVAWGETSLLGPGRAGAVSAAQPGPSRVGR
ncbi:MAG TPA: diaminopimelate epimerase [Micromonosporaceae bacterium]|nr:diaminopimelate epimerase [Micromonosporaceae bacterium]